MRRKIRVAILDDHQAIIDGYLYRLKGAPDIEVVATLRYGSQLESALASHPIDVLLLDLQVPISSSNSNPYPVLHDIPRLLQSYPDLSILVMSMHAQPALIHAMLEAGASGYILKDDFASYRELAAVVHDVASQGIYLSPHALQALGKHGASELSQPLSARQLEALSLCSAYPDASTAQLALKMGIAHSTVRNLLSAAYLKLNVRTRTAAILKAQRMGLIPPGMPLGDVSLLDGS